MPRKILVFLSTFILAVSLSANAQPAADAYLNRAGVEWVSLFNAGNYDSLITLYAEDADAYPPSAPTLEGRAAIQADFDQFRKTYTAHKECCLWEVVADDNWAVERSHYTLNLTPKAGGDPITETGRWIVGRKKVDGKWLIAWEIWNTDMAAH